MLCILQAKHLFNHDCNPNWVEIQEALLEPTINGQRQAAVNQPDIIAHVFEKRKNALLKKIKDGLFGKTAAMVHIIEFQKRGLPHMHLLIFLDPAYKIQDASDVECGDRAPSPFFSTPTGDIWGVPVREFAFILLDPRHNTVSSFCAAMLPSA